MVRKSENHNEKKSNNNKNPKKTSSKESSNSLKAKSSLLFSSSQEDIKHRRKLIMPLIPTSLNRCFHGGLPAGALVEVRGKEGHGKSVFSAIVAASAIQNDNFCCIFDTENSIDKNWYTELGVDWEIVPRFGGIHTFKNLIPKVYGLIEDFRKLKKEKKIPKESLFFIIIDSIANVIGGDESKDADERGYQVEPGIITKFTKRLLEKIEDDISVVFVNQERANTKRRSDYDPETNSAGGYAFAHNVSTRIHFTRKSKEYDKADKKTEVGNSLHYIVEKSKNIGISGQKGIIHVSNGQGIISLGFDKVREAVEEGISRGVIEISGTKYKVFNTDKEVIGKNKLIAFYDSNPNHLDELIAYLNETFDSIQIRASKQELMKLTSDYSESDISNFDDEDDEQEEEKPPIKKAIRKKVK